MFAVIANVHHHFLIRCFHVL